MSTTPKLVCLNPHCPAAGVTHYIHEHPKCEPLPAPKQTLMKTQFKFKVGASYLTQRGELVKVLGRVNTRQPWGKGYECLRCSDRKHRYDRSTSSEDAGRVTGTPHDYSCLDNFKRKDKPL